MFKLRGNFSVKMWLLMWLICELSTGVLTSIKTGPMNSLVTVGGSVQLNCVTDTHSCSNIDWSKLEGVQSPSSIYRNSTGMLNSVKYPLDRYHVSSDGGCNLKISGLQLADSGVFSCSETSDGKEVLASAVLVVFEALPQCTSNASDPIPEGDSFGLSCSVNIRSDFIKPSNVKLTWFGKDNSDLTSARSSEAANSVTLPYGGQAKPPVPVPGYRCGVSLFVNQVPPFDQSSPSADICNFSVSYRVRDIRMEPDMEEFQVGEKVECIADGYPSPDYQWKSGKTGDVRNEKFLSIDDTSSPGDEFVCTAKNMFKGVQYNVSKPITVTGPPSPSYGLIIGIVVGVVVLLICGGAVGFLVYKRYKMNQEDGGKNNASSIPLKSQDPPTGPTKPPRANSNQGIN